MSAWTRERWDHFARRRHRQGLLQKKPQRPGALLVPKRLVKKRPAYASTLHNPKSRQDVAYDDYLADHPQSYETQLAVRYRAAVGRRHMRRRMRRKTKQAQRRRAR